jgi:ATP-dependent Clp protease adapter protein ClpS
MTPGPTSRDPFLDPLARRGTSMSHDRIHQLIFLRASADFYEQWQSREKPRGQLPPPYKVILHNDAAQELMFVVRTVMEVTRLCREEATHKMWEAHHYGCSLLLITYRERAELYVEQFAVRGLTVTIEPA